MAPVRPSVRYPPIPTAGDGSRRTDVTTAPSMGSRPPFSTTPAPAPAFRGRNMTSRIPHNLVTAPLTTGRPPHQPGQMRPPLTRQYQSRGPPINSPASSRSGPGSGPGSVPGSGPVALTSLPLPRSARIPPPIATAPVASASGLPRNTLHRRPSNLTRLNTPGFRSNPGRFRSDSKGSTASPSIPTSRAQTPLLFDRRMANGPTEVHVAKKMEVASAHPVTIYPELDRYRNLQPSPTAMDSNALRHHYQDAWFHLETDSLPPPPTPYISGASSQISGVSGSPSTRFSESPGPGSYSRDTTPTSMSSYSPNMAATSRMPSLPRPRQPTRGRAGSFGKDAPCSASGGGNSLAAIRESINSSSSSSNGISRMHDNKDEKTKHQRLSIVPPSPPPRKSSQRFKKSSDSTESLAKASPRVTQAGWPPVPTPTQESAKASTFARSSSLPKVKTPSRLQPATSPKIPSTARAIPHPAPPARPSRDGTHNLHSPLFHIPIIQSNLTTCLPTDRRASVSLVPAPQSRPAYQKHIRQKSAAPSYSPPQRNQQPHPLPQSSVRRSQEENLPSTSTSVAAPEPAPKPAPKPAAKPAPEPVPEPTPEPAPEPAPAQVPEQDLSRDSQRTTAQGSGRKTRTPSPNISTFRARFTLFSRRTKVTPTTDTAAEAEQKEKHSRKGPAAGTGHEGYSRLGAGRRRSSSASNLPPRGPASSQENAGNTQSQDQFLRDRLNPVIIAGGEVKENQNTSFDLSRTDSNTTCNSYRQPNHVIRNDSQVSLASHEERTTLWPSAMSRNSRISALPGNRNRRPSDSSDSEAGIMMPPTLAYRRSIQRLKLPDQSSIRLPAPINVSQVPTATSSSINSLDTTVLSDDSMPDSRSIAGRSRKGSVASVFDKPPAKKLVKRAKSPRRWNMFGRSQSQPATTKKGLESTSTVAVTIEAAFPVQDKKPIAFYTMIDSPEPDDGDVDIEDILREVEATASRPMDQPEEAKRRPSKSSTVSVPGEGFPLLPPPPLVRDCPSPKTTYPRDPSPVRLGQACSPPKFQIESPADKTPPAITPQPSMGRPSRLAQVGRIPKVVSARQEQISPRSFSRPFNRTSFHASAHSEDIRGANVMKDTSLLNTSPNIDRAAINGMFLAFPPRHNSESTTCTTSQSSGVLTFADSTAVVPDPYDPLAEDEIWDEYNDLLGEGGILQTPPFQQNLPRQFMGSVPPSAKQSTESSKDDLESPIVMSQKLTASIDEIAQLYHRPPVASSVYSSDMVAQVNEALECKFPPPSGQLPPTPFPASSIISSSQNNKAGENKKAAAPQRKSGSSNSSGRRRTRISDGSIYSQVSEDNSPTAQVNIRVGSMSISKWLSFGHVLFSPARDDMVPAVSPPNEHSVLVIDGLGNDDWSFYAAETYPAATFFNLSPRAPVHVDHGSSSNAFPLTPANHHQIQYMSHADKFPFSSDMFTTVVYRFPRAAPESYYRNIISEARRVLKPGGYIELSILDLDLNNMGPCTRRAVRRLKEQMQKRAPDVHLGSTADAILRLLGSKSYTDVKSCRVGVPAASAIRQSSCEPKTNANGTTNSCVAGKHKRDNRSLAEMMNDKGPMADESITNMVARVGRWWHGKCYGDAAAAATGDAINIWRDRALLAECEEWRTNLKLMVCYARVPDVKRVVSV